LTLLNNTYNQSILLNKINCFTNGIETPNTTTLNKDQIKESKILVTPKYEDWDWTIDPFFERPLLPRAYPYNNYQPAQLARFRYLGLNKSEIEADIEANKKAYLENNEEYKNRYLSLQNEHFCRNFNSKSIKPSKSE